MTRRMVADGTLPRLAANLPGLDEARVTRWLAEHVDGVEPPVSYSLIAAGGSNLTFRAVDAHNVAWALRRPPATAVLATAHDVVREHKILAALSREGSVPVPAAVALCKDADVTGAPFLVMSFIDGTILRTESDASTFSVTEAKVATESLVDTQVAMHSLDPDAVGLADLARHRTGYVERQLARWHKQVESARVRETPLLDALHDRLARSVPPESGTPTIVHGDYRFDNTVLDEHSRVCAALDWELCTIGDAAADFAWSLRYWTDPGDEHTFLNSSPTLAPVFPRRDEVASLYAERSGRTLDSLGWLEVFSFWKMACIVEGVYVRRLRGARAGADEGPDPSHIAQRADALLEHARDVAEQAL
jgi:aminoglycoside phosphotransferase (APT) family kinase protein